MGCHMFSESYAQQLSDFELRGYLIGCLWSTSLNKDYHQLGDQRLSILPHFWFGFGFGWRENRFVPPSMTLKGFQGNPDSQNWFAEAFLTVSTGFVGMLFTHYKCLQSTWFAKLHHFGLNWPNPQRNVNAQQHIWCNFHVKGSATTAQPILANKSIFQFFSSQYFLLHISTKNIICFPENAPFQSDAQAPGRTFKKFSTLYFFLQQH